MGIPYIRQYYRIPVRRGARVNLPDERSGVVTSAYRCYLRVRVTGETRLRIYHPLDIQFVSEKVEEGNHDRR